MTSLRVEKVLGPAKREIGKGLRAYNLARAGKSDYRPLAVIASSDGCRSFPPATTASI